jgi:hypothetical protein
VRFSLKSKPPWPFPLGAPLALFLLLASPSQAQDQNQFRPEVDTYVSSSPRSRLFFIAALSADQDTRQLQGEFGLALSLFF